MLNNRLIEYLIALEHHGSFTKASEALNISQPALSRIIKEIEMKLEANLFDRNLKPIAPTEAGRIYLTACKQALNIEKNAVDEILDIVDGNRGTITVAFNSAISRFIVPIIIPEFKKKFPKVQVNVIEKSFYLLEDLVLDGTADIAITLTSNHERLEYDYITTEALFLAIPPSYARRNGLEPGFNKRIIDLGQIKDEPFILLRSKHGLRKAADQLFQKRNISPFIFFETNDYYTSQELTKSDMGFSFTSSCSVISELGDVSLCQMSDYTGQRRLFLCSLKKRHRSKAFNIFTEMLVTHIKSYNEANYR